MRASVCLINLESFRPLAWQLSVLPWALPQLTQEDTSGLISFPPAAKSTFQQPPGYLLCERHPGADLQGALPGARPGARRLTRATLWPPHRTVRQQERGWPAACLRSITPQPIFLWSTVSTSLEVCVDCLGLNKPPPDLSVVIGVGLVQSVSQ